MDDEAAQGGPNAGGDRGRTPAVTPAEAIPVEATPVDRADRVAERLAAPVLIAALASVPAVFLTLFGDPYHAVGSALNTLSGGVLIAETVVLLAVSEDRIAWVRRNPWLVLLTIIMIPAVIFAVGPVQLLRLVRVFGAFRIIRVGRIFKAGRILRERAELDAVWQRVVSGVLVVLVATFVALVLADPTSESRRLLDGAVDRVGVLGVLLAGTVLGVATYIVKTHRDDDDRPGTATDDPTGAADHRGDPAPSDRDG